MSRLESPQYSRLESLRYALGRTGALVEVAQTARLVRREEALN